MLGRKERDQLELFIAGSLRQLVPDEHVLARVDRVLDLSWLREEVSDCYCANDGRPGIPMARHGFHCCTQAPGCSPSGLQPHSRPAAPPRSLVQSGEPG
ncbi:hypothetical protein J2R78_008728 [Bradyrhizobium sp. USDA 4538]|nr:hypothetical protein [Bradyrhizobium sp. USDA 4538]MCP1906982.1 hypothetical protein [Bradyrhizobium sp. USDA 4537]MCP1985458.1 hypothetical protein [Bradyrhizobium sp. USDA 4539]